MGISISELLIIFVILLVLFGPDQLPVIARQFGKLSGELKRGSDAVRREFYNSVYTPANEIKRGVEGGERNLRALKAEILSPPIGSAASPDPRRAGANQKPAEAGTPIEQKTPEAASAQASDSVDSNPAV